MIIRYTESFKYIWYGSNMHMYAFLNRSKNKYRYLATTSTSNLYSLLYP